MAAAMVAVEEALEQKRVPTEEDWVPVRRVVRMAVKGRAAEVKVAATRAKVEIWVVLLAVVHEELVETVAVEMAVVVMAAVVEAEGHSREEVVDLEAVEETVVGAEVEGEGVVMAVAVKVVAMKAAARAEAARAVKRAARALMVTVVSKELEWAALLAATEVQMAEAAKDEEAKEGEGAMAGEVKVEGNREPETQAALVRLAGERVARAVAKRKRSSHCLQWQETRNCLRWGSCNQSLHMNHHQLLRASCNCLLMRKCSPESGRHMKNHR